MAETPTQIQAVQCFGRKKNATAVAHVKKGKGLIKVNGSPLDLITPEILKFKVRKRCHRYIEMKIERERTYKCDHRGTYASKIWTNAMTLRSRL